MTSVATSATVEALPAAWKYTPWLTAVLLLLFTVAVFAGWRTLYGQAQDILATDWAVAWERPDDVQLGLSPITFWYDADQKQLHHRGSINADLKLQLLNVARVVEVSGTEPDGEAEPYDDPRLASYVAAVDQLAFQSNSTIGRYFLYLLALAGLSGVLGVQIRAFDAFIYRAAYKKDLDIGVWWSWYALRPVLGFLLALMAVLLIEARLFVPTTDTTPSGTAWWMALAMLVGFAANDFAQRLRLVGQALFGKDK